MKKQRKLTRVHLGCGTVKLEGFTNVDQEENNHPDIVHNLDVFPYPFNDDSVDEIVMYHVLEHLREPLRVIRECYRMLKLGGVLRIRVPHANIDHGTNPYHLHEFREPWFLTFDPSKRYFQNGGFGIDRECFSVNVKIRRRINPLWGKWLRKAEIIATMKKIPSNTRYNPPRIDRFLDKLYAISGRRWYGRGPIAPK